MSLVELLISASILVAVVVASMQAHVAARRGTDRAADKAAAVRVLRAARVQLETAGSDDLIDVGGAVEPGVPLAMAQRLDAQSVEYALLEPGAVDDGSPVGVRITCRWRGPQNEDRTLEVVDAFR